MFLVLWLLLLLLLVVTALLMGVSIGGCSGGGLWLMVPTSALV